MINLRKNQFVVALILACYCVPAAGQEPNDTKAELTFEVSSQQQQWQDTHGNVPPTVMKPTHIAQLLIPDPWPFEYVYSRPRVRRGPTRRPPRPPRGKNRQSRDCRRRSIDLTSPDIVKAILSTSAGKSVSHEQREFFTTGYGLLPLSKNWPGGPGLGLYAVSETDARKIARAFIEFMTDEADKNLECWQNEETKLVEKIAELSQQVSKYEKESKAAQDAHTKLEKEANYITKEQAQEAIYEINTTLRALKIELAARVAKLEAIQTAIMETRARQEAERSRKAEDRIDRTDILQKLEQMQVDELIELKTAEAKRKTARQMRDQAQDFIDHHWKVRNLERSRRGARDALGQAEGALGEVQAKLADPSPEMLPPEVFQNKVTIYRVGVGE